MANRQHQQLPYLGFGLGLRPTHYEYILNHRPDVDWFEIVSDDYTIPGGKPLYYLDRIREHYPMVMHGVSLSIGSVDPLDKDYLSQIKALADRIAPQWISDHLCWTGVEGYNMHDLLPLPYTEEALKHVVARVEQVQDYLGRQILLENVSSYVSYQTSQFTEWEFLSAVAEQADCLILLDINNIYVSAFNHHFDPLTYLHNVPRERVQQFHVAGHTNHGTHIIDTHDEPIIREVYDLYAQAVAHFGKVSTMIERDDNIPAFPELYAELQALKAIAAKVTTQAQVQEDV